MEVTLTQFVDVKYTDYYDVDVEDFKNWCAENEIDNPNDDDVRNYLDEIDPDDSGRDEDLVEEIIECDKLLKAIS